MRKLKVGLSALSLIAGGIFAASAAPAINTGSTADITIDFGTNGQQIYFVQGLPVATSNTTQTVEVHSSIVDTDGAGKIEGVAYVTISYAGSGTNEGAASTATFIVDVTGNVTSKGNPAVATVTMNLKGNGYSQDANNTVNGASLSLKFSGTATAENTFAGTLNGSIKLGTKTITGNTTDSLKGVPAVITDVESTPFNVSARVVEFNTKFWAGGTMADTGSDNRVPFSGSGTVNSKNGTYSANLKGIGFGKGSSAKLTGSTLAATNGFITVGTNDPVPVIITIPGTATATGKVVGQKLNAANGVGTVTTVE